jgi:hypothetical protein
MSSANGVLWRREARTAWASRSSNSVRFGSSVSASYVARCASASSASLRAVTSM